MITDFGSIIIVIFTNIMIVSIISAIKFLLSVSLLTLSVIVFIII